MNNYFKDTSIFQNIKEFDTPLGIIQAHYTGSNRWHIYENNVMSSAISVSGGFGAKCERIYKKWSEAEVSLDCDYGMSV